MVNPHNTPQSNLGGADASRDKTFPTPPSTSGREPGSAANDLPLGTMPISGQQQHSGHPDSGSRSTSGSASASASHTQKQSDQAKSAAQDVGNDARDAGRAVKDTAAQEAAGVKDDAVREAKRLGDEAGTMLESQASEQLGRAAGAVRTFSDDVARIARGEKPEPGVAKDLVDQLNSRAEATATWLEDHDPKEVLQEVQSFARRRPVAFLAIAAGVGFAAGRLTRGLKQHHADDARQGSSTSSQGAGTSTPGTAPTGTGTGPVGTESPAAALVSGNQSTGAPAYETGPASPTPGYTGDADPYAGGAGR
ncbi:hypothetical protein BCL67_102141 [Nesterenkonia sandarakina]|uniref:Uncharacterized protein n=2 Tax=Nesterenkonia sandarakina TaxID=272918 RepID=A0A2T0YSQ6_9MICC|nr:hypothetical protein BCL67_102141 [Nesterenkonia sandarakina]